MITGAILDICAHHNLRIAATSIHHPVRMEQPSERLLKHFSRKITVCQGKSPKTVLDFALLAEKTTLAKRKRPEAANHHTVQGVFGAGYESRTRHLLLGKQSLYRMS